MNENKSSIFNFYIFVPLMRYLIHHVRIKRSLYISVFKFKIERERERGRNELESFVGCEGILDCDSRHAESPDTETGEVCHAYVEKDQYRKKTARRENVSLIVLILITHTHTHTHRIFAVTTLCYDRRGRYLAVGYDDGQISIWDTTTTGFVTSLRPEEQDEEEEEEDVEENSLNYAVEEMSWGPRSRLLMVTYESCPHAVLWFLDSDRKNDKIKIEIPNYKHSTLGSAQLHPTKSNIAVLCPSQGSAPLLCYLNEKPHRFVQLKDETEKKWSRPVTTFVRRYSNLLLTASGDRSDSIHVVDIEAEDKILKPCECSTFGQVQIYDIVVSRNGKLVLLDCSDRAARLCLLTTQDDENEDDFSAKKKKKKIKVKLKLEVRKKREAKLKKNKMMMMMKKKKEMKKNKKKRTTTTKVTLVFLYEFVDKVNTRQIWLTPCFSSDSEYVVACGSDDGEIYIWNTSGRVIRKLPNQSAYNTITVYHPRRPTLAAVNSRGHVSIWIKQFKPQWTAFAPNFVPVERNTEYQEREDEFDMWNDDDKDDAEKKNVKKKKIKSHKANDEFVDIMTTENAFSSDDDDDYVFPVSINGRYVL